MDHLHLSLETKDQDGKKVVVSITFDLPIKGDVGALLTTGYKKLQRDLEKFFWRKELSSSP